MIHEHMIIATHSLSRRELMLLLVIWIFQPGVPRNSFDDGDDVEHTTQGDGTITVTEDRFLRPFSLG